MNEVEARAEILHADWVAECEARDSGEPSDPDTARTFLIQYLEEHPELTGTEWDPR